MTLKQDKVKRWKDNALDAIIGALSVAVIVLACQLYLDVDRLKASESNTLDDIKEIKQDVRDVRTFLMGEKK